MADELDYKRITSAEGLRGKTIERVVEGGEFFGLVTTDNCWFLLHGSRFSAVRDAGDYWSMHLGIITKQEYERRQAEMDKMVAQRIEDNDRQAYEKLKKRFEPNA